MTFMFNMSWLSIPLAEDASSGLRLPHDRSLRPFRDPGVTFVVIVCVDSPIPLGVNAKQCRQRGFA